MKQRCSGTATRKTSSAKCWRVTSSRASLRTTERIDQLSQRAFSFLEKEDHTALRSYELGGKPSTALRLLHYMIGVIFVWALGGTFMRHVWQRRCHLAFGGPFIGCWGVDDGWIYVYGRLSLLLLFLSCIAEWIRSLAQVTVTSQFYSASIRASREPTLPEIRSDLDSPPI